LQHRIWSLAFDRRLYLAPLPSTMTQALDVGCGTGAWAIEFADAHPHTHITGTDISPIQPTAVPPNCTFMIDDATREWAFGQRFDFIHTRALTMAIGDWDRFVSQAFDNLLPGGWIELQEFHLPLGCDDESMSEGTALWKWGVEIRRACQKVGIESMASVEHPTRLKKVGFENVNEHVLKAPIGPWAKGKREKRLGAMARKDLSDGLDGISTKLFHILGYKEEEVKALLDAVKEELDNPDVSSEPYFQCVERVAKLEIDPFLHAIVSFVLSRRV
ncbi:S-adenosyl-L-methionine-dependent methyltransferase, partial [Rhizodiscina lignyota]